MGSGRPPLGPRQPPLSNPDLTLFLTFFKAVPTSVFNRTVADVARGLHRLCRDSQGFLLCPPGIWTGLVAHPDQQKVAGGTSSLQTVPVGACAPWPTSWKPS